MSDEENIVAISRVVYEAQRVVGERRGDFSLSPPWDNLQSEKRREVINEVEKFYRHPNTPFSGPLEQMTKVLVDQFKWFISTR